MKEKFLPILCTIPIIIIFILATQNILLKNLINNNTKQEPNNSQFTNQNQTTQQSVSVNIYDCKFTVTYRIVDLLENYSQEVPEYSSIIVDQFQNHNPIAHRIPTTLKNNLEENKYYEFTYHIKGTGKINNIHDITNHIQETHINHNENYSVTLTIKETNKEGLDQIQQNICNY